LKLSFGQINAEKQQAIEITTQITLLMALILILKTSFNIAL
jgi:hypothetical protein